MLQQKMKREQCSFRMVGNLESCFFSHTLVKIIRQFGCGGFEHWIFLSILQYAGHLIRLIVESILPHAMPRHPVLWVCFALYPAVARPAPKYFSSDDKAKYAACTFDVWGAIDSLGFAGLNVNAASKECKIQHLDLQKTVCTATVAGVHATFADVASFLSSAASDCAKDLNNPAYCAADSSGLVSALANIAVSAANMHAVCPRATLNDALEIGVDVSRRLSEFRKVTDATRLSNLSDSFIRELPAAPLQVQEEEFRKTLSLDELHTLKDAAKRSNVRKAEITECVFNAHFSAQLLGRAILAINSGAKDCTEFNFKINGEVGQKVCAVDLGGVIGSFVSMGQFLSALSSKCSGKPDTHADCTSAAFNVIAAIDALAVVGASFPLTCGGQGSEVDYKELILP